MKIKKNFEAVIQYLSEAILIIFAPSQSDYPLVGLQPFGGEPFRGKLEDLW